LLAAVPQRPAKDRYDSRAATVRRALQDLADGEGDVDAYIALVPSEDRTRSAVAAAIGRRLLKAGRAKEAIAALEVAAPVNRRAKGPPYRRPIGSLVLRCWKGGIGRAETELWVSGPPERPATSLAEAGHLSTAVASGAGALRVKRGS